MPTYTFEKVELRFGKSGPCRFCGKRLRRSVTLHQTLNPFNKRDGVVKTRAQICEELEQKGKEWCAEKMECNSGYGCQS